MRFSIFTLEKNRMNDLFVKKELETPAIEFNIAEGYLLLEGRSIPEDSIKFYEPLLSLLDQFHKNPKPLLEVDFKLEYFNTSSSKCILEILVLLDKIDKGLSSVIINWFYDEDDEDIYEIGEDYAHFIKLPINLKMIPGD